MFRERERGAQRRRNRESSIPQMPTMQDYVDMANEWNETYYAPVRDMWDSWMSSWSDMLTPTMTPQSSRQRRHRHEQDCCHERGHRCDHDDCQCRCCIHDADLVIQTYLGERRVVPLLIENSRRRERQITLALSEFTTPDQSAFAIAGQILAPTTFVLEACQEREAILVVQTTPNQPGFTFEGGSDVPPTGAADQPPDRRQIPDVEECRVFYADLRVEGCDIRPIRIALVILPRDCDPFEIDCHCSCC